jgi:peptidoglycan hydrolase CwlO-like protein
MAYCKESIRSWFGEEKNFSTKGGENEMKLTRFLTALVPIFFIFAAYGCGVSTSDLNSRLSPLEDRISKLEEAQKAGAASLDSDVKKAEDAAARSEAAAKKADESAVKAEAAANAAVSAQQKAETAEKKSEKQFELMQKK